MAILIHGGHVVTMNAAREVFAGGFVLIGDDGRIASTGPQARIPDGFEGERLDASGMIVLPGLIDASHRPWEHLLMGWPGAADPARCAAAESMLHDEDVRAAAQLAAAELATGGVTTVLHHVPGAATAARLAAATAAFGAHGLRQVACLDFAATGEDLARHACNVSDPLLRLALSVRSDPVSICTGAVDEAQLVRAAALADRHGLRLFTQPGGRADEASWQAALRRQGRSAITHLMELGLLDSRWLIEGLDRLGPADLMLMLESGCTGVAQPLADAALGRACTSWTALLRQGGHFAIGTGGPAASCTVDMVEEMKALVMVQNTLNLDPTAMSAEAALEAATLGGARALGLLDEIGSLEPGKQGDVAVFDMRAPHFQVSHKPVSTFVCCGRARDAHAVFVGGRRIHAATAPARHDDAALAEEGRARRAALLARLHGAAA
ncbi:amidohydrolase family protein [Pseudacidovorax sp. NFM-22]|uniref:amidohydrolase family protein n=1 Tax=Pseudacidovorax sp. NFM-22 TaxID=2744469 RepID=UPI001F3B0E6A|nr:amidohydrolase family protein [Pseudacidovorax sp. NFM-22]